MANGSANIVVIGGGVNGTSIAMHLSRMGAGKVLLLEKGHLAGGASRQVRRDGARTLSPSHAGQDGDGGKPDYSITSGTLWVETRDSSKLAGRCSSVNGTRWLPAQMSR